MTEMSQLKKNRCGVLQSTSRLLPDTSIGPKAGWGPSQTVFLKLTLLANVLPFSCMHWRVTSKPNSPWKPVVDLGEW